MTFPFGKLSNIFLLFFVAIFCSVFFLYKLAQAQVIYDQQSPNAQCVGMDNSDLFYNAANQIDERISQADPSTGLAMYTNRPTAPASVQPRNQNSWTQKGVQLDFTGVIGWDSDYIGAPAINPNPFFGGGALITPRHFVTANHLLLPNGTHVEFFDASGNPITRTVINSAQIPNTDIQVELLDSDVPNYIAHYQVLDTTTLYSSSIKVFGQPFPTNFPITIFNQYGKTLVQEADGFVIFSHFKGHMEAAFGGSIKNLSMGFAAIWDIVPCQQDVYRAADGMPGCVGAVAGTAGGAMGIGCR